MNLVGNIVGSKIMAKRQKTKYPGVFWIEGLSAVGKLERIYYIMYRKNGKLIEEPVGRQYQDDMTPARAAQIRARKIEGDELSNKEKRNVGKGVGKTLWDIFQEYVEAKHLKPTTVNRDKKRFNKWLGDYASVNPGAIVGKDFDSLIKKMKEDGKSAQTIKHVAGMLMRLVRFSSEKGYSPPLMSKWICQELIMNALRT